MPTDDERLAVARRLRRSRSEWSGMGWRLWLGPKFGAVVLSDGNRDELEDAANRLADLIEPEPERTCHDTDYSRESITCSECGEITMNTLYFVDLDGGYRTVKSHRPRFCSNCGARVVE